MHDQDIRSTPAAAFRRALWRAVACIALILFPPVLGGAADIDGYLEQSARRQAQESVSANLVEITDRARAGDAESQYQLGLAYRNGWGIERDALGAVTWLREAADQGHARAQHALGTLYEAGEGVPVSLEKARGWYAKSAAAGLVEARRSLARLTRQGNEAAPQQ